MKRPSPDPDPACVPYRRPRFRDGGSSTCTSLLLDSLPWLESLAKRQGGVARLGCEEQADLVQDVCLEALAARRRSRPRRGKPGFLWLKTIALRIFADRVRYWSAQSRESARRIELDRAEQLHGGNEPPELLLQVELREAIERAIERLPSGQREVLAAQWYAGRSTAELARDLDRSENAIRVLRSRALAQLRNLLAAANEQSWIR